MQFKMLFLEHIINLRILFLHNFAHSKNTFFVANKKVEKDFLAEQFKLFCLINQEWNEMVIKTRNLHSHQNHIDKYLFYCKNENSKSL
jgi:hypothetical protein